MVVGMEFLIILLLWSIKAIAQSVSNTCPSSCGNVTIDYPFGIGAGCYLDSWLSIVCNQSFQPPKPFLERLELEVLNISVVDSTIRVNYPTLSRCKDESTEDILNQVKVDLVANSFFFSESRNKFVARGCNNLALMKAQGDSIVSGCMSLCPKNAFINGSNCNGINCCQTTIPPDIAAFTISMQTADLNGTEGSCNSAFLVEEKWFQRANISYPWPLVPVVLEWGITESLNISYNKTFLSLGIDSSVPLVPSSIYQCSNHSRGEGNFTFSCSCRRGFRGNPYLSDGCRDINECDSLSYNPCGLNSTGRYYNDSYCENTYGSYRCRPAPIFIEPNPPGIRPLIIGLIIGLGLLVLFIGGWSSYKVLRKRRMIKQKKKFFKRNGGLLLQQQLSSHEANVENTKLFKSKDLDKATDHFNVNRILGQGGQGTVYKGMLTDGKIVAVKKSKVIDEGKLQEFINEVVVLSQINHRNVVKLIGCCLETEVPLLVYEYIPNGTLSQHIGNQIEEFLLTWDMRLRIATEVAGALYYLHSAASSPIYHRDIKSSNILLDDKYRAKVADFGTSRSITIDQTHLTTLVHGTFGYLDPEYFQSSQFTEKSDVYSFGVVLAELLTGEKAISSTRMEKSLATYFIQSIEENKLFDILDSQVSKEDKKEETIVIANLAKRCLNLNGKRRPSMKEVAMELEAIQISQKDLKTHQCHEELEYIKTKMDNPWDVATISTFGVDGGTSSSTDTQSLLFSSV